MSLSKSVAHQDVIFFFINVLLSVVIFIYMVGATLAQLCQHKDFSSHPDDFKWSFNVKCTKENEDIVEVASETIIVADTTAQRYAVSEPKRTKALEEDTEDLEQSNVSEIAKEGVEGTVGPDFQGTEATVEVVTEKRFERETSRTIQCETQTSVVQQITAAKDEGSKSEETRETNVLKLT